MFTIGDALLLPDDFHFSLSYSEKINIFLPKQSSYFIAFWASEMVPNMWTTLTAHGRQDQEWLFTFLDWHKLFIELLLISYTNPSFLWHTDLQ